MRTLLERARTANFAAYEIAWPHSSFAGYEVDFHYAESVFDLALLQELESDLPDELEDSLRAHPESHHDVEPIERSSHLLAMDQDVWQSYTNQLARLLASLVDGLAL